MHRRRFLQSVALFGAFASGLTACAGNGHSVRYRLALDIAADGRRQRAFSVIETRWWLKPVKMPSEGRFRRAVRGQAVVADLGPRGLVFGLLRPPEGAAQGFLANRVEDVLSRHVPADARRRGDIQSGEWLARLADLKGEFVLPIEWWPALVRFRDLVDPKSAEIVNGAILKSATIEVTREAVTNDIDERLPWLDDATGTLAPIDASNVAMHPRQRSASARLLASHFKQDGSWV